MMSTSSASITTSVLPPCRSVRKLDWNPTLVKNASMKTSLSVPSKDISTAQKVYMASVMSENTMPPDTGDGMQNFFSHGVLRVSVIPKTSASAPIPAVWSMSSVMVSFIVTPCVFLLPCLCYLLFISPLLSFMGEYDNHAKIQKYFARALSPLAFCCLG